MQIIRVRRGQSEKGLTATPLCSSPPYQNQIQKPIPEWQKTEAQTTCMASSELTFSSARLSLMKVKMKKTRDSPRIPWAVDNGDEISQMSPPSQNDSGNGLHPYPRIGHGHSLGAES